MPYFKMRDDVVAVACTWTTHMFYMYICCRMWKKRPKQNGIATVSLNDAARSNPQVEFISWKVHTDWVQELRYYHEIRQVISCSNSTNTALVIGER